MEVQRGRASNPGAGSERAGEVRGNPWPTRSVKSVARGRSRSIATFGPPALVVPGPLPGPGPAEPKLCPARSRTQRPGSPAFPPRPAERGAAAGTGARTAISPCIGLMVICLCGRAAHSLSAHVLSEIQRGGRERGARALGKDGDRRGDPGPERGGGPEGSGRRTRRG